ncbi:MAG: hypothetical protein D6800_03145 [Candidatus Zixiibacteriota bacterium]|nr:MAG: hypothetical protein D6800_03145 [candidate division Zixibacteria bacterium]
MNTENAVKVIGQAIRSLRLTFEEHLLLQKSLAYLEQKARQAERRENESQQSGGSKDEGVHAARPGSDGQEDAEA